MNKLKSIIEKLSSPKIIAFHFIIFLLISFLMHFIIGPKLIAFTGEMQILDKMILGYDIDYVNKFFMVLEEKGRSIYLYQQIAIDMLYPFAYGGFLCFSSAWILKKRNHHLSNNGFIICLLPLIGISLDLIENTSNAILLCGAKPIYVDIGDDLNINSDLVERSITKKTKAIIAVHFCGRICDIDKLKKISKKYQIKLIEDASQATG